MQTTSHNPHSKHHLETLHNLLGAQIQAPDINNAVKQMSDGLQYLAVSAALGKSPEQLNIKIPPCKP